VRAARGGDLDTRTLDGDGGDRLLEPDPVAQACGQVLGDLLHPTVDPGVLGAALGADQVLQPAAGMTVEQRVEEGQVGRFCREHRLATNPEEVPSPLRAAVAQDPRLERLAVEHVGVRRRPRAVEVDAGGQLLETLQRDPDVGHAQQTELGRRPGVPPESPTEADQVLASAALFDRRQPEPLQLRQQRVLGRADPLATGVDAKSRYARDVHRQRAAAHALPGLEHDDVTAGR
jgi:hypothetical protein